ncbi:MAG TPA: DUF1843 domain-containing protein [Chitinophagaceae bacterium]|jgi:hypothetical protein|nr:DUF1843 domain-containing protein [Chitinophagaceae bacterium]
MSNNQVYDPPIRDSIAAGNLSKMKALLIRAKKKIREYSKIVEATLDLEEAIARLEKKSKK